MLSSCAAALSPDNWCSIAHRPCRVLGAKVARVYAMTERVEPHSLREPTEVIDCRRRPLPLSHVDQGASLGPCVAVDQGGVWSVPNREALARVRRRLQLIHECHCIILQGDAAAVLVC